MIKIHTECGKQEDNERSEFNISHCLMERKADTIGFVAFRGVQINQFS
jgi:hypothetical protein